jgi:hypothetical protein
LPSDCAEYAWVLNFCCSSMCCVAARAWRQVFGSFIDDYTMLPTVVSTSILDDVMPWITAAMSDPVAYPSASVYLLSPPIADIRRLCAVQLREQHGRAWVDAFFSHDRAGPNRIINVHQPKLNWLSSKESRMAIEFTYEDEQPTAAASAPQAHTAPK